MDKLGRNVLYHDTDSIVYVSDGINDPPLGNFLGEFTDELEGDTISTFVSGKLFVTIQLYHIKDFSVLLKIKPYIYIYFFFPGGPKNYGYETKSGRTCCKVRGFTLNFRNCQALNFESIRKIVCEMDSSTEDHTCIPLHNPAKICNDAKRRKVINKEETKLYRVVYNKRVIQPDLTTLPYGY